MQKNGALEGIKVVSFGWMYTAPVTAKYFGEHGAAVIKVESHTRPDPMRFMTPFKDAKPGIDRSGMFASFNSSSLGMTLNLEKPKGREVARRLVKWADVVIESYTPGWMKKIGLDYPTVSKVKPEIVYLSTSQLGQTGPRAQFAGHGVLASSIAGFCEMNGWPDRGPVPPFGAITDVTSPRLGSLAILAALDFRDRTGKGQYIDQSQLECTTPYVASIMMDYLVNGRTAGRNGNRVPYAAPHGVYRCRGDERWCAIAVLADAEWEAFCRIIGDPEWNKDAKFATLRGRKKNEDELDAKVSEWTADYTPEEVETLMQAAGIAASVVESAKDAFEDPQLKHRGHFRQLEHAVMGRHAYDGPGFRLSKSPDTQFAAPAMGQHNQYVYRDLLGFSDDEIAAMLTERVITTEADLPGGFSSL